MIKGISSNNSTLFTSISKDKKNIETEKVEKSKVETIKESIKNGSYKIDVNNTARSMAKKLL